MAEWIIEPTMKKSLVERLEYLNGKKRIVVETGWRWGSFSCTTEGDEPPVIEEGDDLYECGYDVELIETWDGCWEEHEFYGFTEKQEEKMREWLEENSAFDLEEKGFECGDTQMIITCEPEIKKVENES